MRYIALLEAMRFDLAAEYLEVQCLLKSSPERYYPNRWALRMMKQEILGELIRRLMEYENQISAEALGIRIDRDFQIAVADSQT